MKAETKYNPKDSVWLIRNNGIKADMISSVKITKTEYAPNLAISYLLKGLGVEYLENQLYSTKKEAAEAWLTSQGLEQKATIQEIKD
jgi:hypothetical protein